MYFSYDELAGTTVVHFVGRITDSVFSFLGPATDALAEEGVPQTLILLDDPLYRHLLPRFNPTVKLVLAPYQSGRRARLRSLLMSYVSATKGIQQPVRVHVHGFVCLLLAIYASRVRGGAAPDLYSPHGSRSLGPKRALAALAMWMARPLARGKVPVRAIANVGVDARSLGDLPKSSIELVESSIDDVFFATTSIESASPLLVTAGSEPNPAGAAQFAQTAVLLNDEPGIEFCWIGSVDDDSKARMDAANVKQINIQGQAERARRMSSAWIYVALDGDHGFPVFVAEVMALGIPCVAWDTPFHREVVRDGKTGFLVRSSEEALERLALLMASSELRRRMGQAARQEAATRFSASKFRDSLLKAYAYPPASPKDAPAVSTMPAGLHGEVDA